MANSSINMGFAKSLILFVVIVILLEGVLYLGLAIWGIIQEKCNDQIIDIAANPFKFATDLIYFTNEDCGYPSVSTVAANEPLLIQINWSQSFLITNRMFIFMVTYAVISGLWVVSSMMVLASLCGPINKLVVGVCYWPWFVLVMAGSVLDVVATAFFGTDISNTKSAQETFDYVGVIDSQQALAYLQNFDAYFMTPALVLTCLSSRLILIWCLNVFGASFCLSLMRNLAKQGDDSSRAAIVEGSTAETTENRTLTAGSQFQQYESQISHVSQTSRNADEYADQIQPKPLPIQTGSAVVVQRQSSLQYPPSPDRHSQMPDTTLIAAVKANEPTRQTSVIMETAAVTYRSTETHPDKLDYPASQPSALSVEKRATALSELSAESALNHRYSSNELNGQHPAFQSQQRVSDELRSQLPWSYTSMLTKPQPPRKPQVQIYPKIPEPDYGDDLSNEPKSAGASDRNSQQVLSRW